jgi:hypothetical protein
MVIHLTHSLDINPGKFDIDNSDENLYLNKGKMSALLFAIYNFNFDIFQYGWTQSYRYLSGWHVFTAFRTLIEVEWEEGLKVFLQNEKTYKILKSIPKRNR